MASGIGANRVAALREQYKDGSNLRARMRLHERFSTNHYGFFKWMLDQMRLPADASVLDVGAGTAAMWIQNAGRIPGGWRITLSDFSAGILRDGGRALAIAGREFSFAQADAQALPFREGAFDAVVANYMLYHVPDIPSALREIRRVLRPGGSCYAATMSRRNLREFHEIVQRFIAGGRIGQAAIRFGLENGFEYLSSVFPSVRVERYPDELIVTETQPMMDYVNSMSSMRIIGTAEEREALRRYLDAELAANGSIRVTKDSGVLIATKWDGARTMKLRTEAI